MTNLAFPLASEIDPFVASLVSLPDLSMEKLDTAVSNALKSNISIMRDWGIISGRSYLQFASSMLKWVPKENFRGNEIYQVLTLFYYILSTEPLCTAQNQIHPNKANESPSPLSGWIIEYAKRVGQWMDTPESLTQETIDTFRKIPSYRVWEADEPKSGWKSFNHFFSRRLLPGARPFAFNQGYASDDHWICHAADSTFDAAFAVDGNNIVKIKTLPWSINDLLAHSQFADRFAGGTWMHGTLNTYDYHRQHSPVRGTVVEAKVIPGLCALEISANENGELHPSRSLHHFTQNGPHPSSKVNEDALSAPVQPGYEFMQARGLIIIDNPVIGLVAVLPIGMAQVSSVNISVTAGMEVKKGDEISNFLFGGSDIVTVFDKKANVDFKPVEVGNHYLAGEVLAHANI